MSSLHDSDNIYGLMASFASPRQVTHAATQTAKAGYTAWDCHTPFPVHGLDKAMGIKPTRLPIMVFFGGLAGCALGFALQWFTNASSFDLWALVTLRGYEIPISGKPMLSVPAWIPVIFEMTILFSALTCVVGLALFNGLPRHYHPTFKSKQFMRATDDRFFVVIEASDPLFNQSATETFLRDLNPLEIEVLEP